MVRIDGNLSISEEGAFLTRDGSDQRLEPEFGSGGHRDGCAPPQPILMDGTAHSNFRERDARIPLRSRCRGHHG